MTTLDYLLLNYTLEEEYLLEECTSSKVNIYNAWGNGHDVIFQYTIYAEDLMEAYLLFHGHQVRVLPKQIGFEKWVICLKFPGIAIGAFCFSMQVELHLPGAVNVQRVVSLSKRFISEDRNMIGNTFLRASRNISFDLEGQTCTIFNSH